MADALFAAPDAPVSASVAQPPVVVKKYANRRLYNTETSSYITLDNLGDMIRAGRDFVVYDAKSGEDITRGVLTQIIVEEESKGTSMLPTPFLRQLIGFYGGSLQGVVPRYLETAMSSFARQQQQLRLAMQQTISPFLPAGVEEMGRQNMAMIERAMSLFNPFHRGGEPLPPETATAAPATDTSELDRLRHEVESLRAELAKVRAITAGADASPSIAGTQAPVPNLPHADQPATAHLEPPSQAEVPMAVNVLADPPPVGPMHLELPGTDVMTPPAAASIPVAPLRVPRRTRTPSAKGMN